MKALFILITISDSLIDHRPLFLNAMAVLYLIRHGQANVGSTNYDILSDLGRKQAEDLGRAFRDRVEQIDQIHHGTLTRHKQTMEHFTSKFRNSASLFSHEGWNEYDHWNIMMNFKSYYRNKYIMIADMLRKFNPRRDFEHMFFKSMVKWQSGDHDDLYMESWPDFKKRTYKVFEGTIRSLGDNEIGFVFTSGGVISSIVQQILSLPDDYFMQFNTKLVNCSVTKFVRSEKGVFLSSVNDHSVFEKDRRMITYI